MSTQSRFPGGVKENTSRVLTNEVQAPAYAASLALTLSKANTQIFFGQLTGALSLTANVGSGTSDDNAPFKGDSVEMIFSADASARTVTFSTGFASAGTLTVAINKKAAIFFTFDGTVWVEVGRAIGA